MGQIAFFGSWNKSVEKQFLLIVTVTGSGNLLVLTVSLNSLVSAIHDVDDAFRI